MIQGAASDAPIEAQWRFYFAVPTGERDAISDGASRTLAPEDYAVLTELLPDGTEGPVSLGLTVVADSDEEAAQRARAVYLTLRDRAGLQSQDPEEIAYVNLLRDAARYEALAARARVALDEDRLEEAVAWAQTACQIRATEVLRHLIAREVPDRYIGALVPKATSLRESRQQRMFNELCSVEIQDTDWWSGYQAHVARRNRVVHEGAEVSLEDAARSIAAMESFIDFVTGAANRVLFAPDDRPTDD